jgi:hypothetical protein
MLKRAGLDFSGDTRSGTMAKTPTLIWIAVRDEALPRALATGERLV